jgi:ATP-dependent Clp protease adaptor protein ClpS
MTKEKIKNKPTQETDDEVSGKRTLILHNDDVHTFDYVIDALVKICRHEYIQASQCASITHFNGKCDIKRGYFSDLKILKDALTDIELTVTIE